MEEKETFPFVIKVETIAGKSVEETCNALVRLSQHLGCLVSTEINDTRVTVGGIMTEQDAYESWLFYSKQNLKKNEASTHCQFENTAKVLRQVLEILRNTTSMKDLLEESSVYERAAIKDLPYVCKDILSYCEYFRVHETHEHFKKNLD